MHVRIFVVNPYHRLKSLKNEMLLFSGHAQGRRGVFVKAVAATTGMVECGMMWRVMDGQ